ncbi:MAG: hypothetical protein AB8B72_09245 [Crocinitomicaceae bacterium]
MKSTQVHIIINILCFITILISLYFGMSTYNAIDNQHISHLNDFENSSAYGLDDIRVLTAKGVIGTGIFVVLAFAFQIYSFIIADFKTKKNVILALFTVYGILFIFSFIVMSDLDNRNFHNHGQIWLLLSLTLIFANSILIFYKKK